MAASAPSRQKRAEPGRAVNLR